MEIAFNPEPIRAYMKRYGLTQGQFGKLVDRSQAAVSQWLNGEAPSIKTAKHIERRTGGGIRVARLFPDLLRKAA